jgi:hypothetical protein
MWFLFQEGDMRYVKMPVLALALLFVSAVAFAADAVTGTPGAAAPVVVSIWSKIGMGALGGAIAAIVGWLKNRDVATDKQEPFDLKYLVCTVVVGAILGAIGAWQGLGDAFAALNWAEQSALWACVVAGGEMALKAIFRQGAPRINDILAVFKKTGVNPTAPVQKP